MVYCLVEVQYFASQELTCWNNRCQQAWVLKESIFCKTAKNWGMENV